MNELCSGPASQVDELIALLRCRFIHHEAFEDLQEQFDRQLRRRRAAISLGNRMEARCIAILGASGSGKTTATDRLFEGRHDLILPDAGEDIAEVIRLQVPSPATLKYVGSTMLSALGYPLERDKSAGIIWDQVRQFLHRRRTLFVHLDEAQDLYTNKGSSTRNDVVNTLKILMNNKAWPVGLILSGTPDLAAMINSDIQLKRRTDVINLDAVTWASHGADVRDLFEGFVAQSGLIPDEELADDAFLKRLVHASGNEFGLTIDMLLCGIEEALYSSVQQLGLGHYAEAFRRKAGCIPAFNPFLATDYLSIDVRRVMGGQGVPQSQRTGG